MSATGILEKLPKLNPSELETIYRCAVELHQGRAVVARPELLAAVEEADRLFAKEGRVSVDEARRAVTSWNTKPSSRGPRCAIWSQSAPTLAATILPQPRRSEYDGKRSPMTIIKKSWPDTFVGLTPLLS